jgi:hypothetical protein
VEDVCAVFEVVLPLAFFTEFVVVGFDRFVTLGAAVRLAVVFIRTSFAEVTGGGVKHRFAVGESYAADATVGVVVVVILVRRDDGVAGRWAVHRSTIWLNSSSVMVYSVSGSPARLNLRTGLSLGFPSL